MSKDVGKTEIKQCADSTMLLGHLNANLLARCSDCIDLGLNHKYRKTSFSPRDHPTLLFGNDIQEDIKYISETKKLGQTLSRHQQIPRITFCGETMGTQEEGYGISNSTI